ncbi:hypothetical protein [Streptomyces stelliscabiei]|uniref:hypothetical protein n=1 Tax=Streptomyces stelliscabiei TaxID=146820 RepID=UPI0029B2EFE9|nr:hypothetical protein [Streptomyces stelliscabiei]MDX2667423.1 hypothetical protein [Streptomyces stelliscabiei]MDX2785962.1 hypothetical protein [Streptomyces stelliscabiei]
MRSDDPSLDIIREAIERLIPGATPAYLGLHLTERHPARTAVNTWTGTPQGLAERIHTALFGRTRTEAQAARRATLSRSEALKAITRVLKQPVEDVPAADLIYGRALAHVEDPEKAPPPWAMQVDVLAMRIAGALPLTDDAGERSPLAQAEDAKRKRDLVGELSALVSAERALESAPWYPCRPGDLVHVHYEAGGEMAAFGETYIVGDASDTGDTPPDPMSLVLLAHTLPASTPEDDVKGMTGCFEAEAADCPVHELWFEAGPHRLTIVRDGRVVHNGSAR